MDATSSARAAHRVGFAQVRQPDRASSLESVSVVRAHRGDWRPVAGYLSRFGHEALLRELLDKKLEHVRLKPAGAVVCVRRVGEVAFLVRVDGQVVELVFVGFRLGDGERLALVDALVPLARLRPELLVVVVAGELDEVPLPVDVDLGDDGL